MNDCMAMVCDRDRLILAGRQLHLDGPVQADDEGDVARGQPRCNPGAKPAYRYPRYRWMYGTSLTLGR